MEATAGLIAEWEATHTSCGAQANAKRIDNFPCIRGLSGLRVTCILFSVLADYVVDNRTASDGDASPVVLFTVATQEKLPARQDVKLISYVRLQFPGRTLADKLPHESSHRSVNRPA